MGMFVKDDKDDYAYDYDDTYDRSPISKFGAYDEREDDEEDEEED